MRRGVIVVFAIVVAFSELYAQRGGGAQVPIGNFDQRAWSDLVRSQRKNAAYASIENSYAQFDGDPYLYDEYQKAVFVLNNDRVLLPVQINYDGYQEAIVSKNDKGEAIMLDDRYYKEMIVITDTDTLVYAKVNPENKDKLYHVLYQNGDFSLFKEFTVYENEGVSQGLTNDRPKLVDRTRYYIIGGDGIPQKVKLKAKRLFKHFPAEDRERMKSLIKEKKLKLKSERDFRELFSMMN